MLAALVASLCFVLVLGIVPGALMALCADAVVRMLALVFAAGVLAGCASSFPPAPAAAADADYNYIIGPGDSVQIVVWRNPDLSQSVPVRPDGKIAALQKQGGLTRREAESLRYDLRDINRLERQFRASHGLSPREAVILMSLINHPDLAEKHIARWLGGKAEYLKA